MIAFIDFDYLINNQFKTIQQLNWDNLSSYMKTVYQVDAIYLLINHEEKAKSVKVAVKGLSYHIISLNDQHAFHELNNSLDLQTLQFATYQFEKYNKAIIVTKESNYFCLVSYSKLQKLLSESTIDVHFITKIGATLLGFFFIKSS